MPNGNPNFETEDLPDFEAFFRPLEPTLERFAATHNLTIERYHRHLPAWTFRFRHPLGGEAYVEVYREADAAIRIHEAWWQDDYEVGTRSATRSSSEPIRLGSVDLYSTLTAALNKVLRTTPECLDQVHTGYAPVWHRTWSKEEFDALTERFPQPVVQKKT
jgi:hypothetical protein